MKVVVSREANKGDREGDFHWTQEGDILLFPAFVCEGDRWHREKCGCGRSFSSIETSTACTVGTVDERTEDEVRERLAKSSLVQSWSQYDENPGEAFEQFWADLEWIAEALADVPNGATVRVENEPGRSSFVEILERVP